MRQGMTHIYTGDGKGKTTAACGLILRALGHGMNVVLVRFMKPDDSGEISVLQKLANIKIISFGRRGWVSEDNARAEDRQQAKLALQEIKLAMADSTVDMVVADELCTAVYLGLLEEAEVLRLMKQRPAQQELVITGHHAGKEMISKADLVTNMQTIKHPYQQGVGAREGIEY